MHGAHSKTWSSCIGTDRTVFQVCDPFVERCCSHFVEFVYADQDLFRKDFCRQASDDSVTIARVDTQTVAGMHTGEVVLTMIDIIRSHAEVEIKDTDGVDFFHIQIKFISLQQ